jgi:hypothetical protein
MHIEKIKRFWDKLFALLVINKKNYVHYSSLGGKVMCIIRRQSQSYVHNSLFGKKLCA